MVWNITIEVKLKKHKKQIIKILWDSINTYRSENNINKAGEIKIETVDLVTEYLG